MMLSDVCRIHREYSWSPQLLEASRAGGRRPGVRCVWAGAGPKCVAYRVGDISWRSPAYSLLRLPFLVAKDVVLEASASARGGLEAVF